ncbi:MAG TPA: DHA2 family efflux MFS transporter permease subunit [Xanthobacteraceae bacterium]|jgi:DHA2 family multidrug resistance protein|nr:DHA2 family efflux MFS transporter permease subunit [Xanthobacteraceae bacterium]
MSEQPRRSGWDNSRSAAGDRNPWLVAVVVSIATFMVVLDTAIANVSLRYIAGSLAASVDESTWVVTTYLIANAVVLPASGWLSNVVGRKRFYMICVALFTISSLFCGLAPNLSILIVCRILQGLGGGGMPTSEQAILADTFPPEKRGQAFALYGIAVIVAPTVGPTVGGWITDNFSWHWIFFINVPIGIVSLALVHWLVEEPEVLERERAERLAQGLKVDWAGFLLIALTLGCLEVVLDRGEIDDWFHSQTIVIFSVMAAITFLIFVPWELMHEDPIVELRLLMHRQFGFAFFVMLMVGAILFGSNQIMPQLLQTSFPYTAMLSGLAMMPGGIAMLVIMPIAGIVTGKFQPKYLMAIGLSGIALSMWYSTSLTPDASFSYFGWIRVFQMVGLPFMFIPINTVAYDGLQPSQTNQASALMNVARNLGGSIGISLANVTLTQRTQFHQSRLAENTAPSSPAFNSTLQNMTRYFTQHGSTAADAKSQAMGLIGSIIHTQATILAYIDVFYVCSIAAAVMVPLVLVLVRHVQLHRGRGAPAGH